MKRGHLYAIGALSALVLIGGVVLNSSGNAVDDIRASLEGTETEADATAPATAKIPTDPNSAPETFSVQDPGTARARVALAEYELGVVEEPIGCNCGPRIDLYTDNNQIQWCASFASWVTKEAGSPLTNASGSSWRIGNSRAFAEALQAQGQFYSREQIVAEGLEPEVGDFIVFFRGEFEDELGHVDILARATGEGRGDLIGGNVKDRLALRADFPYLDYAGFLGFGRPEPV